MQILETSVEQVSLPYANNLRANSWCHFRRDFNWLKPSNLCGEFNISQVIAVNVLR